MIKIIKGILRKLIKATKYYSTRFLPIKKNVIVFSSYYGREYCDNPKYIAESLHASNRDFKLIWVVSDKKYIESLPKYIIPCRKESLAYYYYMNTSGIWIDNCRNNYRNKREGQFYIQTWHGGSGQKKVEKDVEKIISPNYVAFAKKDAIRTNLMISESRFMTDLYHSAFWYNGPVFECGYPRYDLLIEGKDIYKKKVCDFYNIDYSCELLLYAPTFRADQSFNAYSIDFDRLIRNLKKRYNKDYIILVHLHPNVASIKGGIEYDGKTIINSTFYPDTQELLAASSFLIGDYSSIGYDFSLQRKPVIRYCADLKDYYLERGFYLPFVDYPYPYAENNDELERLILNFDEQKYLDNLDSFLKKMGSILVPNASQKVSELISNYVESHLSPIEFIDKHKEMFIFPK